jgi:putative membrane protein
MWAALVLIILNTFIRPILIFISLPLVLLSLGLFLLVINGIIVYCLPDFVTGFHVARLSGAIFGSIFLSIITWFFGYLGRADRVERVERTRAVQGPQSRSQDVIDI